MIVISVLILGPATAWPDDQKKDQWSETMQPVTNRVPTGLKADLKAEAVTRGIGGSASDIQDILDQINELASEEKKTVGQLQENLALKRSHESQYATLDNDVSRYEADVSQAQSYCTGTFPEPEYSRRVASFNSEEAELNSRRHNLASRREELDAQEKSRVWAARAL